MTEFHPGQEVIIGDVSFVSLIPRLHRTYIGGSLGVIVPRVRRGPRDQMGRYMVNITPNESDPARRHIVLIHETEMTAVSDDPAFRRVKGVK